MSADALSVTAATETSALAALTPLLIAVLIDFLVIGVALPVLPLHVRGDLGYGPAMVGVVAGCQFAAALIARVWSGQTACRRCGRPVLPDGVAPGTSSCSFSKRRKL